MGVVSSTGRAVVVLASVTSTAGAAVVAAAVVSGAGGWVDVIMGGGVELQEGTAHGQLQTLTYN